MKQQRYQQSRQQQISIVSEQQKNVTQRGATFERQVLSHMPASTEVDKFDEDRVPSPGIENAPIENIPHADCIQCLPCNTLDEIWF